MNPIAPSIAIPIAETFAIISNSFLEGFFKMCQTRLDLSKNDFVNIYAFFTIVRHLSVS